MGEVVGAAIVSHVPPIVMPEEIRRELNDGDDFTLVEGLHRLRRDFAGANGERHRRHARG